MLFEIGHTIRDTWEVERFLGEGAFAEVYRVKHRFLGRQAMKVFKIIGLSYDEVRELLDEAGLLSQLGHPNIIRVFDANVTEISRGMVGFFTMEYVAGGSLDTFRQSYKGQFIPLETVVEIILQVCRGISVAHSEKPPIIHRDIKPQNILVGYDETGLRVRVSDFGLAKRANPLTLLASSRGTLVFKAPEVFRNPMSDSRAGDVWAIGSILYLLLTDQLPYTEENKDILLDHQRFDLPLVPCEKLNPMVDDHLERIISRSIALESGKRYQTAAEMKDDLIKWKPQPLKAHLQNQDVNLLVNSNAGPAEITASGEKKAMEMINEAIQLSRFNRLNEGADLMEEVFNIWPEYRKLYEYKVRLWRRGIVN
jgi:serine/threonine protein kinase